MLISELAQALRWTLVAVVLAAAATQVRAQPITKDQFTVTDGDTIHVIGEAKGTRLVGFNAPETYEARCDRERELVTRQPSGSRSWSPAAASISRRLLVRAGQGPRERRSVTSAGAAVRYASTVATSATS